MSNVKVRMRPDEGREREQLRDTVESPGYALIAERLRFQRQQYVDALLTAPPDQVASLQGAIAAVTRSLEVPEILRKEYKNG